MNDRDPTAIPRNHIMTKYVFAILLAFSAGSAQASCEDAWYLRNLAFDRAGYCFGSALGRALFDNGNCSTKSPALSDRDMAMVEATRAYETLSACKINTGATSLDTTLIGKLDEIDLLPTIAMYESLCIGFAGPDLPMRSDVGIATSYPTGDVVAGDTVHFRFETTDGFEFVETDLGAGWIAEGAIAPDLCQQFAG